MRILLELVNNNLSLQRIQGLDKASKAKSNAEFSAGNLSLSSTIIHPANETPEDDAIDNMEGVHMIGVRAVTEAVYGS